MALFKKLINSQVQTRKKLENFSYVVEDIIGQGYSSKVYKGRNDLNFDPVAIKVIDVQLLNFEVNRTLLESQIKILKSIHKIPNILMLYEIYSTKNNIYIITELCSTDLSKKIGKHGLPKEQAYRYMDHFLKGFAYLYEQKIIHRDLKPANLLISEKNILKIADFGFGIKQCDAADSKYNVGSPLYMAPQSLKRSDYSFKTDIWGIGIIFFQMLTGATPWTAKTERELIRKVQSHPIDQILKKHKFQPFVKDFLMKTLAYNPEQRMDPETLLNFRFRENQSRVIDNSEKVSYKKTQTEHSKRDKDPSQTKLGASNIKFSVCMSCVSRKSVLDMNESSQRNIERQNRKLINGLLTTQINFCRFLFKTIKKINESAENGMLSKSKLSANDLVLSLTAIIKEKIRQLKQFQTINFMDIDQHKEYSEHMDCKKLVKYSEHYHQRFSQQLETYWKNPKTQNCDYYRAAKIVVNVMEILKCKLCKKSKTSVTKEQLEENYYDLVLLQSLVFCEQYLTMIMKDFKENEDYELFASKTNIQEQMQQIKGEMSSRRYQQMIKRAQAILKPCHTMI